MATFSLGVVGTSYHKPPGIYGSKKLSQFVLRLGEFSWSRARKQRYCACMASGQVGISWRSRSASGTLLYSSSLTWLCPGLKRIWLIGLLSSLFCAGTNFFLGFQVFPDGIFPAGGKSEIDGIFPPPYFEWFQFNKEFTEYTNLDECISYLCDYMVKNGPFEGLLGFSQVKMKPNEATILEHLRIVSYVFVEFEFI